MAASSSEIAKSEESKAITIAPAGGPHSIGLTCSYQAYEGKLPSLEDTDFSPA